MPENSSPSAAETKHPSARGFFQVLCRRLGKALVWLALVLAVLWAFGALWFDFPLEKLKHLVAIGFLLGVIATFIFLRPSRHPRLVVGGAFLVVLGWWLTLQPRQDRDWKPEVATLAYAEMKGDLVMIHNVRNFEYRTESDFIPRYEKRSYDLRQLRGVDLFINTWSSPIMAHPIVSFDFGEGRHVCFSIETRPERNEGFSALGGLYRRFELIYVVADERDVVRLRTNYRKGEEAYLYRLNVSPERARDAFMEYVWSLNELHAKARWYNAITDNCTTAIRHQRATREKLPWDWRMLINGYADRMMYEHRAFDQSVDFDELKRRARVTERARAADQAPDFSEKIRAGIPGF